MLYYLYVASYISWETSLLYPCSGRELNFCEREKISLLVALCYTTEYQSLGGWTKTFIFLQSWGLGVKIKPSACSPKASFLDLWLMTPSPYIIKVFPPSVPACLTPKLYVHYSFWFRALLMKPQFTLMASSGALFSCHMLRNWVWDFSMKFLEAHNTITNTLVCWSWISHYV